MRRKASKSRSGDNTAFGGRSSRIATGQIPVACLGGRRGRPRWRPGRKPHRGRKGSAGQGPEKLTAVVIRARDAAVELVEDGGGAGVHVDEVFVRVSMKAALFPFFQKIEGG